MIWWVYQNAKSVTGFDRVVVALDDERVERVCEGLGMEYVMTSPDHKRHLDRLHEVSEKYAYDYYVSVCGDEPLTTPEAISQVLPDGQDVSDAPYVLSLMRELQDPPETNDPSNIKVVTSCSGRCLIMTRSPVPFPYVSSRYSYKKLVGIECFNKAALDFFVSTEMAPCEQAEDITLMRFIENDVPVILLHTDEYQLGVDTVNDLEKVRTILSAKLKGETDG